MSRYKRPDTRTGISHVQLGRGSNVGAGVGGCYIHDDIRSILLGRASYAKIACMQLGRSGGPPLWGTGVEGGGQGQRGVPYTQQHQSHMVGQGQ